MKKNRMMRAASLLLVAVLLTTCTISGTFAKYTTSKTASDSARVAKFGVEITGDTTLFGAKYVDEANGNSIGAANLTVQADANVVAPGTTASDAATFTVNGTPEVAVRVSYEGTVELSDNWEAAGDFYCPLQVTVGAQTINGLNYDSADDFTAAIKAEIDGKTKDYAAGTTLSDVADHDLAIGWEWPFEGATGLENDQTDDNDTELGDTAVAENLTIGITVTCTVTQID